MQPCVQGLGDRGSGRARSWRGRRRLELQQGVRGLGVRGLGGRGRGSGRARGLEREVRGWLGVTGRGRAQAWALARRTPHSPICPMNSTLMPWCSSRLLGFLRARLTFPATVSPS